jgi:hypothetical protein
MTADVAAYDVLRAACDRPRPCSRALRAGSGQPVWSSGFTAISIMLPAATLATQVAVPDLLARAGTAIAIIGIVVGVPHGAVDLCRSVIRL